MSQSVERLKELLFEDESQALARLERRLQGLADTNEKARGDLEAKLQEVFDRAGTNERLTVSVAEILDEALRRAEITQHADLSRTIAPLVVTTIKSELRNSQDEMVEALYPITGRLVKSYVASAIKDLNVQINRRLEQNPVMLRFQSLTTGKSVAELALAGSADFAIQDLFLIRRGSGDLIARWPEKSESGRDQSISAILAAINEFANEAFAASQSSLRKIDLGDASLYLRGSPLYLLAARCTGPVPPSFEQTIDDAFLAAISRQQHASHDASINGDADVIDHTVLAETGEALSTQIAEASSSGAARSGGMGALKRLAAVIAVPVAAWVAWSAYSNYAEGRVRTIAMDVLKSAGNLEGYPAEISVGPRGSTLAISGLAPDEDTKRFVLNRLSVQLSKTEIRDGLKVIPGSRPPPDNSSALRDLRDTIADVQSSVANSSALAALDATLNRLRFAVADIGRAGTASRRPEQKKAFASASASVSDVIQKLEAGRINLARGRDQAASDQLFLEASDVLDRVARSIPANIDAPPALRSTQLDAAARLTYAAERAAYLSNAAALQASIPEVQAPAAVPIASPRDTLERFIKAKAIFFANDSDYLNPALAQATAADLAPLIKSAGLLVRVVGYGDEPSGLTQKTVIALQRAEKVRDELASHGVPANLLTAVSRADVFGLSTQHGSTSPNRRVEFEIGFDGEQRP